MFQDKLLPIKIKPQKGEGRCEGWCPLHFDSQPLYRGLSSLPLVDCRITEWLGLKATSKIIKFQRHCHRQGCQLLGHLSMCTKSACLGYKVHVFSQVLPTSSAYFMVLKTFFSFQWINRSKKKKSAIYTINVEGKGIRCKK